MSTFTGFAAATEESRELPRLACLGFVEAVGEAKVSGTGTYIVQPITIGATQSGVKSFVNILYRPEWLRPDFTKADVDALGGAKKSNPADTRIDVYRMHVSNERGVSSFAGIAGSQENFLALAVAIQQALEGVADEDAMKTVENVLREFVNDNNPTVGYYSSQKKEKVPGQKEKVAVPGKREVSGYFYPGAEADKYNKDQAAKGKLQIRYELD